MSKLPSGSTDGAGSHEAADAKSKAGDDDNSPPHDHGDEEGEDEGGAPTEGDESGLNENQKSID